MKKLKTVMVIALVAVFMSSIVSTSLAVDPEPFPIGIFWPPSPENTSVSTYQDIAEMNANFVLMGNGNNDFAKNDAALTSAASNGLKVIVDDARLVWNKTHIVQTSAANGKYVRNTNSLGQTVISPWGTGWGMNIVKLYIDKNYWPAGVSLTLSVYDSPSKTTLIGSDTITGPVDTYYPEFQINKVVNQHTSYYMELTSNSSTYVGWVVCSSTNTYTDGVAYENGTAQAGYDFWFDVEFAQRMYNDSSQPTNSDIDDVVNHFKNNSALAGYNILDEPEAKAYTRLQATIDRIRTNDSSKLTYVNLLPGYADANQLGFGGVNGGAVTPTNSFAQTFKTNSATTFISTIQLYIDRTTWGANEPLTLKLWNSAAKSTLIAQNTLNGSSTNYPVFTLNANVSANTSYYFELTHGTEGLMVSANTYRKYLWPYLRQIIEVAKKLKVPFIYHTDGRLWELFNDFAELGVNGIQPLEPKSMDFRELKEKEGHRFCLMGSIDIDLLSRGTRDEIDAMVAERIKTLGYNGGYTVGTSNTVPEYVNIDNYRAMIEAAFTYV